MPDKETSYIDNFIEKLETLSEEFSMIHQNIPKEKHEKVITNCRRKRTV